MTRWDDPSSDPMGDLQRAFEQWRMIPMPTCEVCGGPVREQRCDPIDITEPWDRMRTMVPGPTYNLPCNCPIPGTAARPRRGRTPSGEHTSADTDDVVASIDAAVEDWETLDGARWSPDGSHEHDPSPWTRMNLGVQQGQADWGCDDVAEQMTSEYQPPLGQPVLTWTFNERPGSTACFPWEGAQLNSERMQEAMRGFTDAIHQMQMSLYRSAARVTRQWSEIFAEFLERNEPVRVQLHTGRNSGRTEAIERARRLIEQRRVGEWTATPPHADLEPLELPTIQPGDEVEIHWRGGSILPQTIDEHERRTRASWEGLT